MEAEIKAEQIFEKYFSEIRMPSDCEGCMTCVDRCGNKVAIAKKYSLIAVEEIVKSVPNEPKNYTDTLGYWNEVKQEIEKL